MSVSVPPVAAEDLATLAAAWRSIGLRAAEVTWELAAPARIDATLASQLRSALGPALAAAGARSPTLTSIPGDSGPPALWFQGWERPSGPVTLVRAEMRCVGAVEPEWPELDRALARLRLPAAGRGRLADTLRCTVAWHGSPATAGAGFGGPIADELAFDLDASACVVEAVTPLRLRTDQRELTGPPPLTALVRAAGDRLRRLCAEWGAGAEALPPVVARAWREAHGGRMAWATAGPAREVTRRSSSTGQVQVLRGVLGVFAYEDVTPLAMAILTMGAELGVGKGVAFGCGQIRIYRADAS